MPKYYKSITKDSNLDRNAGASITIPLGFNDLSSSIISECSFLQKLIQQVIYITHGAELTSAKKALTKFPNPKARMDFLCSFPFDAKDEVVSKVFDHARNIFKEIYELRNVLAHELWTSSVQHPNSVVFSNLDEEARLLMVSGRVWHKEDATPQEVYDATIRFIRSVKVISCDDLISAIQDASLCSWMLIHIENVIKEEDNDRKEEARKAFFVFKGTSHLFGEHKPTSETVDFRSARSKNIKG